MRLQHNATGSATSPIAPLLPLPPQANPVAKTDDCAPVTANCGFTPSIAPIFDLRPVGGTAPTSLMIDPAKCQEPFGWAGCSGKSQDLRKLARKFLHYKAFQSRLMLSGRLQNAWCALLGHLSLCVNPQPVRARAVRLLSASPRHGGRRRYAASREEGLVRNKALRYISIRASVRASAPKQPRSKPATTPRLSPT